MLPQGQGEMWGGEGHGMLVMGVPEGCVSPGAGDREHRDMECWGH